MAHNVIPFEVAQRDVAMPADGTDLTRVFGFSEAGAWAVTVDGDEIASTSGDELTVTFDASDMHKPWRLTLGGQERVAGHLLPRHTVSDASGITTDVTVTTGEGSAIEVTVLPGPSFDPGTLADVALSGDYGDLDNTPTLGTAAAAEVGDFATAAQGTTADTAVQPGDLHAVATSGDYDDLDGKPTIPSTASDVGAVPDTRTVNGQALSVDVTLDADDVGAVDLTSVGLLPGERNRGNWDAAVTYAVGDVVHDHQQPIALWKAVAPSTNATPHLSPESWESVDPADRHIALGFGAAADGDAGSAFGPASDATGDYSLALGPLAHAEGTASVAIGPLTRAEDNGEVNLANLIVGKIDPFTLEPGDLWLAAGAYTGGEVTGGVIRRATSLSMPWTTAPSAAPTDVAVGTALHVRWDATVTQPRVATYGFGPRGIVNIEGVMKYSTDQTAVAFEPIAVLDTLGMQNTPGQARTMVPAWTFGSSRFRGAENATVTLGANDTNSGGAAFADTPVWFTKNGTVDGVTNSTAYTTLLCGGAITGNVDLYRRIGVQVDNLLAVDPGNGYDPYAGSVAQQIGLFVPHLTTGVENFGVWNGSATAEVPQAVTIASSSATIPRGATTYHLTASSLQVVTGAAPIIADGVPGERITLTNVGAHLIALGGETAGGGLPAIAGSNISQWIGLGPGACCTLRWNAPASAWVVETYTSPQVVVSMQSMLFSDLGATHAKLEVGIEPVGGKASIRFSGGTAIPDTSIERTAAGVLTVGGTAFSVPKLRIPTAASAPAVANSVGDITTIAGVTNVCTVAGNPGTWQPVLNAASNVAASQLTGTIATARLGTGTANDTTWLRGDQTWAAPWVQITQAAYDDLDPKHAGTLYVIVG